MKWPQRFYDLNWPGMAEPCADESRAGLNIFDCADVDEALADA